MNEAAATVAAEWAFLRRADQTPPHGDWSTWLILGGRGAGKTRTGAEWVGEQVRTGCRRIALIAPTLHDARIVMVEGESGLLNTGAVGWRPTWNPSLRQLLWPNGAQANIFSAEDPDSLRGPQFDAAWADEFCAWSYPEATLTNLRMGLRLGEHAPLVVTTTPRPIPGLRTLIAQAGTITTRAATADNTSLSKAFRDGIAASYAGTALGRQELLGEIVEDVKGSLWPHDLLTGCRAAHAPELERIVVAVDPPVSSAARSDACGIVVAGRAAGIIYVLEDATAQGLSPSQWASRVAARYDHWQADCVVAEVNQGGELVTDVLRRAAPELPIRTVHASRGKRARAEPVAIAYEQGRVRHVGVFAALEDEMNRLGTSAQTRSPDRADALVWAVTTLLEGRGGPAMRML